MGNLLGSAVFGVIRALETYGVDGFALARRAGVPPQVLSDPSQRFDSEVMDRLMLLAAEAASDPGFALALGNQHALMGQDVHYALVASHSLAEALGRLGRYQRYIGDHFQIETKRSEVFEVAYSVPEPSQGTWLPCDLMASCLLNGVRMLLWEPDLAPCFVALRRPRPSDVARYRAFFRADVRFDSDVNELHFPLSVAARPLPLANAAIAGHADSLIQRYLALHTSSSWTDRVLAQLAREMPDGLPKRSDVARELGLSERGLGRHLANEDTSFRQLLDQVRIDLACGYLASGRSSVTEIAFLLGFSETSAFSRAFKRWKGVAPAKYVGPSDWPQRSTP